MQGSVESYASLSVTNTNRAVLYSHAIQDVPAITRLFPLKIKKAKLTMCLMRDSDKDVTWGLQGQLCFFHYSHFQHNTANFFYLRNPAKLEFLMSLLELAARRLWILVSSHYSSLPSSQPISKNTSPTASRFYWCSYVWSFVCLAYLGLAASIWMNLAFKTTSDRVNSPGTRTVFYPSRIEASVAKNELAAIINAR